MTSQITRKSTIMDLNLFERRLKEIAASVEAMLERLLAAEPLAGEIARPARLLAAMRHGALAGGKRLRPFLTIATAEALGVGGEGPLRAGSAIELVHCYSLVHDDLPAMDDDDLRRGRPTVHKAFDEATAILAGDGLLTLAFDVMGEAATHVDGAIRSALCVGLARAAGLGGMAGGQMLDLEAETASSPLGRASVERLQAMKTGALLSFSVEAGAIIAKAAPAQSAALLRYGRALGAAFQAADDILDAEGDESKLGKKAGKDAERNKATLIAALGLEGAKAARDRLADDAAAALDDSGLGARAETLRAAARFVVARVN
jgi:farnesyl diphosphate synthase